MITPLVQSITHAPKIDPLKIIQPCLPPHIPHVYSVAAQAGLPLLFRGLIPRVVFSTLVMLQTIQLHSVEHVTCRTR